MTSLASTALDEQLTLLRWAQTDLGERYCNAAFARRPELHDGTVDNFGGELMRQTLVTAETYAVSTEIVDLLDAMAPSMPDYTLHPSDVPSGAGFTHLERPILIHDIHGNVVVIKQIAWVTAQMEVAKTRSKHPDTSTFDRTEEVVICLSFTMPDDPRDHSHQDFLDIRQHRYANHLPKRMPMASGAWGYGTVMTTDLQRFIAAFWRFIQEPWVDSRMFDPDRPLFKRAARQNVQPSIKLVHLRRAAHQTKRDQAEVDEDGGPEWSHRWLVRTHWRNQWYPSIQQHRPVLIPEHIKGPDDKPLVVHDKIFIVDR